ncbi:MAG TPA: thioredoxin family protein [Pirellulales bacterium]
MHQFQRRLAWRIAAAWALLLCGGCEIREAADVTGAGYDRGIDIGSPQTPPADAAAERVVFQDLERGSQRARTQQKPLLIFFTAEWCKFCHQMAQETFTQEAVIRLSQSFVCVVVDADSQPRVCREFDVHGFPTVQFMSPGGVRLNRVTGKQSARQFLAQMNAALSTLARRPELTAR